MAALVSAIVVSTDRREALTRCLEAFYATAGGSAEAVVIDNASGDGSSDAVRQLYPMARLIRHEREKSFAQAGNTGLALATGRFLLLLSPEVLLQPRCVGRMADFLMAHQEVGAVSPRLDIPVPGGRPPVETVVDESFRAHLEPAARSGFPTTGALLSEMVGLSRLRPQSPRFNRFYMGHRPIDAPHEIDAGSFACLMLRQAAVDRTGFLDPGYGMYCEDLDLCFRLKKGGWRVYYHPLARAIRVRPEIEEGEARRRLWAYHRSLWRFHSKYYTPPAFVGGLVWAVIWSHCLYKLARQRLGSDDHLQLGR